MKEFFRLNLRVSFVLALANEDETALYLIDEKPVKTKKTKKTSKKKGDTSAVKENV